MNTTTQFPGGASGKEPTSQCRRQKRQFWSLGQEDPLKEGMATHSSILAWRIPWTEAPAGIRSIGFQRVGHDWSDLAPMYAWIQQHEWLSRALSQMKKNWSHKRSHTLGFHLCNILKMIKINKEMENSCLPKVERKRRVCDDKGSSSL